jgi:hypothetical protein
MEAMMCLYLMFIPRRSNRFIMKVRFQEMFLRMRQFSRPVEQESRHGNSRRHCRHACGTIKPGVRNPCDARPTYKLSLLSQTPEIRYSGKNCLQK